MPNWVRGEYAIKGTKKNVLNFLNEGLMNSGCEPMKSCKKAFDCLKKNAKTKDSNFHYADNGRVGDKLTEPAIITFKDRLTFDTFRPMPDTFKLYDTTNCAENMPTVAKEQERLYGCVGWYDWGLKYRGTKWNEELDNFSMDIDGDVATITFECSTAWSYPYEWLQWVHDTFDVAVLLCVSEESNMFNFYGSIDDTEASFDMDDKEGCPNESDFENEDDYYDALNEWRDDCIQSMFDEFHDYVADYQI